MIRPAVRRNLYEEVIGQMTDNVRLGIWVPGDRIPGEKDLSQQFQVSRNCIREAIKAMESTGIIDSQPGRGTFVAISALRNIQALEFICRGNNDDTFAELFETRMVIEPEVAGFAAQRATEEDIARMERSIKDTSEAYQIGQFTVERGFEFHTVVAEACKNDILIRFLQSINAELRAQRATLIDKYVTEADKKRQLQEHDAIFLSIKRRETEKASALMYEHLDKARKMMVSHKAKDEEQYTS